MLKDRSFDEYAKSVWQQFSHFSYHERQAFTGQVLAGVSGITARVAQWLVNSQEEHRRQGRTGPIAPRMWVIARDLGCHVRSIVRAFRTLKLLGAIVLRKRWRAAPGMYWRCASWVTVFVQPERAKARRELAMNEAQILEQLRERMRQPIPGFTEELAQRRELEKRGARGLPPRSSLSKALEARGLHVPMSDISVGPKTSSLYSDTLLPPDVEKPPDGG
jgi:hypothetical protein